MNEQALDKLLSATLFRKGCPDASLLADYVSGFCDPTEQRLVAFHLPNCTHCQHDLERLEAFVDPAPALRWHWMEKVKQLVITLAPPPALQPSVAFVFKRDDSGAQEEILRHIVLTPEETNAVDFQAVITPQSATLARMSGRVQIPERWPSFSGIGVRVAATEWSDEATTDEDGFFTIEDIPLHVVNSLQLTLDL